MDALLRLGLSNTAWATALAALAWCVSRICQRRPALIHALWLAVLLKLVTPSLVAVPLPEPSLPSKPVTSPRAQFVPQRSIEPSVRVARPGPTTDVGAPPTPVAGPGRATHGPLPWRPVVATVWLAGVVAWWLAVGVYTVRFRRFLRSAQPAPAAVCERAEQLAARLGLRGCPVLGVVPARVPPMLWALFGRPRLLLPEALWEQFSPAQQETVLAHELAHLKRRDHWVRWLEVLVLSLHWWNPLAWWARREVERAEEPCCDAWVTWALPGSAHDYAEALVATAAFLAGARSYRPVGASGAGRARLLKRRLIMLLSDSPSTAWARSAPSAVLLLAALSLPLLPVWAGQADDVTKETPQPSGSPSKTAAPRPADAPKPGLPALAAGELVHPIEREVTDFEEFTGRVEPVQSVELRPRVSGVITKVAFPVGGIVKRGEVLFEIDARAYQAELDKANAKRRGAQARRQRRLTALANARNLEQNRVVGSDTANNAQADAEEADAEVSAAEATLQLARLNLELTHITAPIDGRIGEPILTEGNVAVADKTLLATIVALEPMYVTFQVDERTALRIGRLLREGKLPTPAGSGLTVAMALTDESDFPHRGKLLSFDNVFDPSTGTTRWRAVFPNPDHSLVAGLFARVRVTTSAPRKALLVPRRSVFVEAERGTYVSVSLGRVGAFEARPVKVGQEDGDLVEVREGRLSTADHIYVNAK
ncbi:MAG: efflux RND transporter periplasmic adaptor subunit [Isosphaeraceae bacterium]|nr:efflux RND transporter periplasmic adaptor subunit [Isosphaeraceae bacterium]